MDSFVVDRVREKDVEAYVKLSDGAVEVWVPEKSAVIPAIHALEVLAGQLGPEILNLSLRVRTGRPEENGYPVYDIRGHNPARETDIYIGKRRPKSREILETYFEHLKYSLEMWKTVSEIYPAPRWERDPGDHGLSRVRLYRTKDQGILINGAGRNPHHNGLFHLERIKNVGDPGE